MSASTAGNCSALNQSLMELGALVCTPRNAQCLLCPVRKLCVAFRENRVEALPNLGQREPATARHFAAFVVERDGKFLVRQRAAGAVNAHLWEFPNVELGAPISAVTRQSEFNAKASTLRSTATEDGQSGKDAKRARQILNSKLKPPGQPDADLSKPNQSLRNPCDFASWRLGVESLPPGCGSGSPPAVARPKLPQVTHRRTETVAAAAKKILGFAAQGISPLVTVKHSITRYRITLEAFRVNPGRLNFPKNAALWKNPAQLRKLAFTSAHRRILRAAVAPTAAPRLAANSH